MWLGYLSPANEFSIYKVPFEDIHVEDVQVERVGLNAVKFAITSHLWLSLVEIGLSSCLAVELLDIICPCIEQITMVCFLVTCRKSTEDQNVLV